MSWRILSPSSWKIPIELPRRSISKTLGSSSGDGVDVDLDAVASSDVLQRPFDDREVAQSQEVHLQQTELLDRRRLVLGDDRRVLGRTRRPGLSLHRHVVEQRLLGDDDRRGVDAVLSTLVDEAHGDVDRVLHLGVVLVEVAQFGRLDEASLVAGRRRGSTPRAAGPGPSPTAASPWRSCRPVAAGSRARARRRAPRRAP